MLHICIFQLFYSLEGEKENASDILSLRSVAQTVKATLCTRSSGNFSQGTLHHFRSLSVPSKRTFKPCLPLCCIMTMYLRPVRQGGGFPGDRAVFGAGDVIRSPLYPPENRDSGNAGSYGAALCGRGIVRRGSQDQTSNITSPCCCTVVMLHSQDNES